VSVSECSLFSTFSFYYCTTGTGSFPGVKSGRGVTLSPHPIVVPWSRKSRAIPLLPLWAVRPVQSLSACTSVHFTFIYTSTPPMGHTACTEPQCLHKGALYLYLYLYSPYGPYSLYRASVPVQGCTLPLSIPLLPLWAIQPVQSLSACTRVHFTFHHLPSIIFLELLNLLDKANEHVKLVTAKDLGAPTSDY